MSVAIRAITRLQDADDINVSLGVGVDEYALCWDNDTARFVLRAVAAGVTDHGALTGLSDDDHAGYALLAGRAGGQTLYGGNAANDDLTIHGTSNATRTTSYVLLQPTAGNVGIGTTAPVARLHISDTTTDAERGLIISQTNSGAQAGLLNFRKSRSGAVVQNGDYIGLFFAMPFDGTNYIQPTGFGFKVNGTVSTNSIPTDLIISVGSASAGSLQNERMRITSVGLVGIGTESPASLLHGLLTSAATNVVTNVVTIGHDTTGTAAAGFGAGIGLLLESSTTAAQSAARIQVLWYEATHATRKADLVLSAYDTAAREGMRIRGDGSAAAIGFLGATPAARIAHVADPAGGGTVDAEARTAINSILATLETFGFHATS